MGKKLKLELNKLNSVIQTQAKVGQYIGVSVVHTITNSIKIEGRQCNNSLNLAFDEPAEVMK